MRNTRASLFYVSLASCLHLFLGPSVRSPPCLPLSRDPGLLCLEDPVPVQTQFLLWVGPWISEGSLSIACKGNPKSCLDRAVPVGTVPSLTLPLWPSLISCFEPGAPQLHLSTLMLPTSLQSVGLKSLSHCLSPSALLYKPFSFPRLLMKSPVLAWCSRAIPPFHV